MPDAANIGILQDATFIAGLAMFAGMLGYKLLRLMRPGAAWNHEGVVLSRPYGDVDVLVMVLILALLLLGVMQPAAEAASMAGRVIEAGDVALSMIIQLVLCSALLVYLHQFRELNPAELFGFTFIRWKRVLLTIVLTLIPMLVIVGAAALHWTEWLQRVSPGVESQDLVKAFTETENPAFRALVALTAIVVAPVVEETIFRGFFYGVLKRYTDAPFAAVITGLFFAIMHLHVGSLVPLWVLALILCAAYEFTGCLLVPIVLHSAFNTTSIALMLAGVE